MPFPTPKIISGRFWLSYALTVAVSSLMPISQTIEEGTVTRVYLFMVYQRFLQALVAGAGLDTALLVRILVHLAVCFVVAYGIRRGIFQAVERARNDERPNGAR